MSVRRVAAIDLFVMPQRWPFCSARITSFFALLIGTLRRKPSAARIIARASFPVSVPIVASSVLSVLFIPYHHRDVPPAHWCVMVVGVAPEKQGKGIGRALLQPIIERAETAGQPCYLETAQPANVGLYERLGFRRVVDMVEPQSGLRLWTFRRDPPRRDDQLEFMKHISKVTKARFRQR